MTKKNPDITILMSTYNRRKYLPSVLKDMQAQTLSNWKLIIVNDGGDNVEDIVAAANDARIEYYDRPHLGKAAQLNYAMELVESKYIGYLDDDDKVMPEHYDLLFKAAETNKADFVYSNVQPVVLNFEDDSVMNTLPVSDNDIKWEDIRLHNQINHSTILHTKALAEKVGKYDERMQVLIDFDYIKRLASVVKPLHVHATTYQWNLRQDDNGRILSISGLWERNSEMAGRSLLAFFEKDPESLAICYLQHGEIKKIHNLVEIKQVIIEELEERERQTQKYINEIEERERQKQKYIEECEYQKKNLQCQNVSLYKRLKKVRMLLYASLLLLLLIFISYVTLVLL